MQSALKALLRAALSALVCLCCLSRVVGDDAEAFKAINLDYPGLEGVRAAVEANDYATAKGALLDYYKARRMKRIDHAVTVNFGSCRPDELLAYLEKVQARVSDPMKWMGEDNYRSGSNWAFGQHRLGEPFIMGAYLPELRAAQRWRELSLECIHEELSEQFYPDGGHVEGSISYHGTTMRHLLDILRQARASDIELPHDLRARALAATQWLMYVVRPDWILPTFGDGGNKDRSREIFGKRARALWPDVAGFELLASKGASGAAPPQTSIILPYSGHIVMRTEWQPEALWLLMKAGPAGSRKITRGALASGRSSHSHRDQLSFMLSALGENFLMDWSPKSYTAKLADGTSAKLASKLTEYHNTITVDGDPSCQEEPLTGLSVDAQIHEWASTPAFDFVQASVPLLRDVTHERSVLFVKPSFWLVRDRVLGDGTHRAAQHWLFNEGQSVTLEPSSRSFIARGKKAWLRVLSSRGAAERSPAPAGLVRGERIVVRQSGSLPLAYLSVLCPGTDAGQDVELRVLQDHAGAAGVVVSVEEESTHAFFAADGGEHVYEGGQWSFTGACGFVRSRAGRVVSIGLVRARLLRGPGFSLEFPAPTTMAWDRQPDGAWQLRAVAPHFAMAMVSAEGLVGPDWRLWRQSLEGGTPHETAVSGDEQLSFTLTAGKTYLYRPEQ